MPWTRFLLQHGALTTGADCKFGFTPLHWAAADGSTSVLRVLRTEAGMQDVDEQLFGDLDKDGRSFRGGTALLVAVLYGPGRLEHIDLLLKWGANVNCKEDSGLTPLAGLCWGLSAGGLEWRVKVADLLLRSGADEKLANEDGKTPLDLFTDETDPDGILKKLLQNADVDRAWRRRGVWVMFRSFMLAGNVGKRNGPGRGRGGRKKISEKREENLLEWVARVDEEGVFRAIVAFL